MMDLLLVNRTTKRLTCHHVRLRRPGQLIGLCQMAESIRETANPIATRDPVARPAS